MLSVDGFFTCCGCSQTSFSRNSRRRSATRHLRPARVRHSGRGPSDVLNHLCPNIVHLWEVSKLVPSGPLGDIFIVRSDHQHNIPVSLSYGDATFFPCIYLPFFGGRWSPLTQAHTFFMGIGSSPTLRLALWPSSAVFSVQNQVLALCPLRPFATSLARCLLASLFMLNLPLVPTVVCGLVASKGLIHLASGHPCSTHTHTM